MIYQFFSPDQFFENINTESQAIALLWNAKFSGVDFICSKCQHTNYYQIKSRPEIRQCKSCKKQYRVRADTIFEHSKIPILIWLRAIFFMMMSKRGISAQELKIHLQMKSYGTVWMMQHRIRDALRQRDDIYYFENALEIEIESSKNKVDNIEKSSTYIELQIKDWIDEAGKQKLKHGFARVMKDDQGSGEEFVKIKKNINMNKKCIDKMIALYGENVQLDRLGANQKFIVLKQPWVHKLIANCELWISSTYRGVQPQHLNLYVAEYFYKFNRRHDQKRLFHRALYACALSKVKYSENKKQIRES